MQCIPTSTICARLCAGAALLCGLAAPGLADDVSKQLAFIPAEAATYGEDGVISGAEVRSLMRPQLERLLAAGESLSADQLTEWAATLTRTLLDHRLLYMEALKAGYRADPLVGQRHLDALRQQMGAAAYADMLATSGVPAEILQRRLAEGFAVDQWITATALPTDTALEEKVREYYRNSPEQFESPASYNASHVLVAVPPDASRRAKTEARDTAEGLRKRIGDGEDFVALARQHSACPSGKNGGRLGSFTKGQMVAPFEQAAVDLAPGQISDIIETEYGYHIIKGGTHAAAGIKSFEEVRGTLANELREKLKHEAFRQLGTKAREKAGAQLLVTAP